MSMPGIQERPPETTDGQAATIDHVPHELPPFSDQARHWIKGHRTFIASSTSSVLSTLSAVRFELLH